MVLYLVRPFPWDVVFNVWCMLRVNSTPVLTFFSAVISLWNSLSSKSSVIYSLCFK